MEHLLSQTMKVDNLRGIVKKMSCFLGLVALILFFCNLIGYWSSHMAHLVLRDMIDEGHDALQTQNVSDHAIKNKHHGPTVQSIKKAEEKMKAFEAM